VTSKIRPLALVLLTNMPVACTIESVADAQGWRDGRRAGTPVSSQQTPAICSAGQRRRGRRDSEQQPTGGAAARMPFPQRRRRGIV